MVYFVVFRHPVPTLVAAFDKPDKLTNDIVIFKLIDDKQIISLSHRNRSKPRTSIQLIKK